MKVDNVSGSASASSALAPLPTLLQGWQQVGELLRLLLADFFTLYLKTKNFHWHMSGAHFRDYHLLLDEQAEELFEATDTIAERARKIGETTLRSIGDIARYQRLTDADASENDAVSMLRALCKDNNALAKFMREAHEVCDATGDLATASLLENWIDEAERRSWFLSATVSAG
jgi:starvation-inducible DNA-binding protein